MYDNFTASVIRNAPRLPELDVDGLPEQLTRDYTEIVSNRVKLREREKDTQSINRIINFARRLGQTNEALVLVNPNRENRISAAFVSATAYQLEYQAKHIIGKHESRAYLQANRISTDISAMLLFLISKSYADASEVAEAIIIPDKEIDPLQHDLIQCLIFLAKGQLEKIQDLDQVNIESLSVNDDADLAVNTLYYQLIQGLRLLARCLLTPSEEDFTESSTMFLRVKKLASLDTNLVYDDFRSGSLVTFLGPYTLASLLIMVGGSLRENSITNVPPPDGVNPNDWNKSLRSIANSRPYLWQNHQEAVNALYLKTGVSSVVNFPTGAGKSIIAQLKILSTIHSNKSVIFLVPTNALVDQTVRDLSENLEDITIKGKHSIGSQVGMNVIEKLDKAVLVTTPESCLQHISIDQNFFSDFGLLVFDECHILDSKTKYNMRAFNSMLCILNFLFHAPNADLMLISAMLKNVEEIGDWIKSVTKRESVILSGDWKPTRQLRGCIVYNKNHLEIVKGKLKKAIFTKKGKKTIKGEDKCDVKSTPFALFSVKKTWEESKKENYSLVKILDKEIQFGLNKKFHITPNSNKLAANVASAANNSGIRSLVLAQTIPQVNSIVKYVKSELGKCEIELNNKEKELLEVAIDELGNEKYLYLDIENEKLMSHAVAHHGILLPEERRLVESLYRKPNGARIISCTSTLSEGMNLPAELVIIAQDYRFSRQSNEPEPLGPEKLLNAAGRAGRAGIKSTGIVLLIPGNILTFDENQKVNTDYWEKLREIFGQSDQCLKLEDPIELLMDNVHNQSDRTIDVERYVFNCLVDIIPEHDVEKSFKSVFQKSFASYRMQKLNEHDWIESRMNSVLDLLNVLEITNSDDARNERFLAASIGVPVDVYNKISSQAIVEEIWNHKNVKELCNWMFEFFLSNPECFVRILWFEDLNDLFEGDFENLSDPIEKVNYAIPKLKNGIEKWMDGEPLCGIQSAFSNKTQNINHCVCARKFVVRIVPSLSQLLNAPAKIFENYTKKSENEISITPELSFLYQCVRSGYSKSEMAALASIREYKRFSRRMLHSKFEDIEKFLDLPNENETTEKLIERINSAITNYEHDRIRKMFSNSNFT